MQALLEKYEGELERCGLILKDGSVVEVKNIAPEPKNAFYACPEDLLPYLEEDLIAGTWHTHPNASSNLSPGDHETFVFWPDCRHYIVGSDGVSCYVVKDNTVFRE